MGSGLQTNKPRIFVHSCCGPCSTAVTERLAADFSVTLFFYNPNITDEAEYLRRLESQRRFVARYNLMAGCANMDASADICGVVSAEQAVSHGDQNNGSAEHVSAEQAVPNGGRNVACRGSAEQIRLIVGPYEPQIFLDRVADLEESPEGGARCEQCFALRLEKTAEAALTVGTENFTTTLSVSPHKNYAMITQLGTEIARRKGLYYHSEDFKKKDGYRRSVALAKEYELYRQDYCGCLFSKKERGDAGRAFGEVRSAVECTGDTPITADEGRA